MSAPGLTVYTKPACVQCDATHRAINKANARREASGLTPVPVQYIDISTDSDALAYVKALGYQQAPVVAAPDGSHWSGFDPSKVKEWLPAGVPQNA